MNVLREFCVCLRLTRSNDAHFNVKMKQIDRFVGKINLHMFNYKHTPTQSPTCTKYLEKKTLILPVLEEKEEAKRVLCSHVEEN